MDLFKVVSLSVDEVLIDPAAAACLLEKACQRQNRFWRVTGCCSNGENSLFFPVETTDRIISKPKYFFSKFSDLTLDSASVELRTRFEHGFSCLGTFRAGDDLWGLFFRNEP